MISQELLRGTLKTIVLKLLSENNRMYGYEITREVEDITRGKIKLTWGALYPTLHRLEADGLIISEEESIGQRIRKYYSLTKTGNRASREKVNELKEFIDVMRGLINPKPSMQIISL